MIVSIYFISTVVASILDVKGKWFRFLFYFNLGILIWSSFSYWHRLSFERIPISYDNPWYLKTLSVMWLLSVVYSAGILIKTIWNALIHCLYGVNEHSFQTLRNVQNHFEEIETIIYEPYYGLKTSNCSICLTDF